MTIAMMTAFRSLPRFARYPVILGMLLSLNGCAVGYYWQASAGHLQIVNGQEPVEDLLKDSQLLPPLRDRLEYSQQVLEFAHDELRLPDNGSYTGYFDTGSPYVVWNVFAAPELQLEPRTWCFPIAGCVAYRGYFSEPSARAYAGRLAARGDDIFVGGITAYSTLGRFRDPLLNTMLKQSETEFAGLLFHELAHQLLYVQDDSAFNESFATTVELEGIRRWQLQRGQPPAPRDDMQRIAVLSLLRDARAALQTIYASDNDAAGKRVAKQRVLDDLGRDYSALTREWQQAGLRTQPYAQLFRQGWNNASLVAVATYDDYVPAFQELLRQCGRWLACFYVRAEAVAALTPAERAARLQALMATAQDAKNNARQ